MVADSYITFDLASILIPFASEWRTTAVAWGVIGLYLLVAIQITSWPPVRARLSRRTWRRIHLLSFPLLFLTAMQAGAAGTDVGNVLYVAVLLIFVNLAVFVMLQRILAGRGRTARPHRSAASTTAATPSESPSVAKRLSR